MAIPQPARDRLMAALERGVSKGFTVFYEYVLENPVQVALATANEIAESLGVDAATVVRASQHMGYSGWPQLQKEFRALFGEQPAARKMDRLGNMATGVLEVRKEFVDPDSKCECRDCRTARLLDSLIAEIHTQFGKDARA
ncbi:MAG: MurR/RpiR family transcriptional regulator [Chloroflexi bacterium]|nr:MurR/RpiR family transcriptional regulator [Chloroflexota bacterium]